LKCAQNLVASHSARAELFQQLNRFGNRHNQIICALFRSCSNPKNLKQEFVVH
jgi:hypothetical protein